MTKTEIEMKKKELRTLEQALIDKVKELIDFSESPAFCIPYIAKNGRRHFVIVGPHNAIPGLLAQARKQG